MNQNQNNEAVLFENNNSKNLLVTFGGISQGFSGPAFEFFKSLKDVDCDKIFIRDFKQAWYHNGIDNKIKSIEELKKWLQNTIAENEYQNVCFMGNSMGGYAAMLLGTLLNVNTIMSFAPQSYINPFNRILNRDFRWRKQMSFIYKSPTKVKEYFDLKSFFKKHNQYNSDIKIYYSTNHRLDKNHAERLTEIKNVSLFPFSKGGHGVAKDLRDSGELHNILNNIFLK